MGVVGKLKWMSPSERVAALKVMHPEWFNGDDMTPKHCDAFRNLKPTKPPESCKLCSTCKGHGKWHVRGSVDDYGKNTWSDCECPDCRGRGWIAKIQWNDAYVFITNVS